MTDYETGGVGLNDASQGLLVQTWVLNVLGNNVNVGPLGGSSTTLFSAAGITEAALTFDQAMHPTIAYIQSGTLKLYWYDTSAGSTVTSSFGTARNPRLTLDDKRATATRNGTSDILLCYVSGTNLNYRQQRDRYNTERTLLTNVPTTRTLKTVGMSNRSRIQFRFR